MSTTRLACATLVGALLAGCAGSPDAADPVASTHVVMPGPWVFEPAAIRVTPGADVTFENRGGATHSVTIEPLGIDLDVSPGQSVQVRFDEPGDYDYVCKYHPPDMRGRVLVAAAPTPADAEDAADQTS